MTLSWENISVNLSGQDILHNITGNAASHLTVVFGSNGSGKTTLLKSLIGHIKPITGRIILDGTDITRLPVTIRFRYGLVSLSQHPYSIPDLTPTAYLALYNESIISKSLKSLGKEAIDIINDSAFVHVIPPATRRLLDLVITLSTPSRYVILDEPLAGLPNSGITRAIELIAEVSKNTNIIVVEHRTEFLKWAANESADSYYLENGMVTAQGKLGQLLLDEQVLSKYGGEF